MNSVNWPFTTRLSLSKWQWSSSTTTRSSISTAAKKTERKKNLIVPTNTFIQSAVSLEICSSQDTVQRSRSSSTDPTGTWTNERHERWCCGSSQTSESETTWLINWRRESWRATLNCFLEVYQQTSGARRGGNSKRDFWFFLQDQRSRNGSSCSLSFFPHSTSDQLFILKRSREKRWRRVGEMEVGRVSKQSSWHRGWVTQARTIFMSANEILDTAVHHGPKKRAVDLYRQKSDTQKVFFSRKL